MHRAIERELLPALHTPDSITTGHLLLRLLSYLRCLEDEKPSIGAGSGVDPALAPELANLTDSSPSELDLGGLSTTLAALIVDPRVEAQEFMRTLARSETEALIRRDPAAAAGIADAYLGGRVREQERDEVAEVEVTPDTLTAYFSKRFPERKGLVVKDVQILSGGFSKQTISVELLQDGALERIVLRKDLPVNPTEASAVEEYPLLQAVCSAGVPVPEPLWSEPDRAALGTPFIAVRYVSGTTDVSRWRDHADARRRFARSLAAILVRLQSMPTAELSFLPRKQSTLGEQVAAQLDEYQSLAHRSLNPRRPLLDADFAWLRFNIPDSGSRISMVHGDIGFHNMLILDGNVNALLDWEFAHYGDPLEDLFYCKAFVEQVVSWDEFLKGYVAQGGIDYDRSQTSKIDRYYEIWRNVRNAAACARPVHVFLSNERAALKSAVAGLTLLPRFELEAFNLIVSELGPNRA
jgi:aminoglycoside phosphotransferase (APT) family kinase protein